MLSEKDREIIRFIDKRDFCFLSKIKERFFKSPSNCSEKLSKLKREGYISMIRANQINLKRLFNERVSNKKIVFLEKEGLKEVRRRKKPSLYKAIHQILLSELKDNLEHFLNQEGFYENEIRQFRGTIRESMREPFPDFFISKKEFKLAVELELNLKSLSRYNKKISDYSNSSYTHILYVVLNKKIKESLLKILSYEDKFAVTYYRNFKEPFSFSFGRFKMEDWLSGRL